MNLHDFQNDSYDPETTLVYGFEYIFSDPKCRGGEWAREQYRGTFVDFDYGYEWDDYDHKWETTRAMLIKINGVECQIPDYYVGRRTS